MHKRKVLFLLLSMLTVSVTRYDAYAQTRPDDQRLPPGIQRPDRDEQQIQKNREDNLRRREEILGGRQLSDYLNEGWTIVSHSTGGTPPISYVLRKDAKWVLCGQRFSNDYNHTILPAGCVALN